MVTREQGLGLVVFSLAGKEYAFETRYVREVITARNIIPVPQAADCVAGVVSLRSKVIPVINLRKKFNLPDEQVAVQSRLIVVQLESHEVGVVVDTVVGVSKLTTDQVFPPDEILSEAKYLMGVGRQGDRLILLVDVPRLLSGEEQEGIRTVYDQIEIKRKG